MILVYSANLISSIYPVNHLTGHPGTSSLYSLMVIKSPMKKKVQNLMIMFLFWSYPNPEYNHQNSRPESFRDEKLKY